VSAADRATTIAAAAVPIVLTQVGEWCREVLRERRAMDAPCAHGRPGGRLCGRCADAREEAA
jgi:hypothetical protein